jgi:hypothetical protein
MKLNKKNIFLLDGIGAAISASFTGLLLPVFSDRLGLPTQTLYSLALFPLVYAIYSLSCYWIIQKTKTWMLLGIVTANLIYCLISGGLIFFYEGITSSGRILLAAEILVILGVVIIEFKVQFTE